MEVLKRLRFVWALAALALGIGLLFATYNSIGLVIVVVLTTLLLFVPLYIKVRWYTALALLWLGLGGLLFLTGALLSVGDPLDRNAGDMVEASVLFFPPVAAVLWVLGWIIDGVRTKTTN